MQYLSTYNMQLKYDTAILQCSQMLTQLSISYIIIGSLSSDHYFRSVCWFVCLCRVFLSRFWSNFDQTWTHVICHAGKEG